MIKFLLLLSIGIIPLVLWGSYFYLKNPRKEAGREVFKILALGTISILPVILFHQWLLKKVVKSIEAAWPLFEAPFFKAVLELGLLMLFILLFVSLFALISALIKAFKPKDPFYIAKKVSVYKKLYHLTPILVLFVALSLIDGLSNLILKESFLLSLTGSILVFAILEEYFKYIINPFLVQKKIHSVGTAMVHALYVGLAFAFVENLLFFYVNIDSPEFESVVIYRSIFTTLLHISASGILGYFYGLSLFSGSILTNYEIEKGKYKVPFWVAPFFKKETVFESISVNQGFFLAAMVHSGFNIFLNFGMKTTASVLVILVAVAVVFLLRSKISQVQYGLIGTTTMPEIDFEQLRLKISVLKEMKGIRDMRLKLV